jgi:hypothetical protein
MICNCNYMSTANHGGSGERVHGWFVGRLPDGWFTGPPEIILDREEITIIGQLPGVKADAGETAGDAAGEQAAGGGAAEPGPVPVPGAERPGAEQPSGQEEAGAAGAAAGEGATAPESGVDAMVLGRSRRFREETRDARIAIAREAEATFGRKISWGVVCEGRKVMFTTLSVPVMTRLRQAERRVLDTLVDAGVARSRSDALAWCVRLVGQHEDAWLEDLREALRGVEHVRVGGPRA